MSDISRRFEQSLKTIIAKNPIIPVKTDAGILVGDVIIENEGTIKNIRYKGELVYKEISLNVAAIKIANILAKRASKALADKVYLADQEYGRWFVESQMLRAQYQKALSSKNHDKADMLWARYCESRDKTIVAKHRVERLSLI